jgi:hypothetical protein
MHLAALLLVSLATMEPISSSFSSARPSLLCLIGRSPRDWGPFSGILVSGIVHLSRSKNWENADSPGPMPKRLAAQCFGSRWMHKTKPRCKCNIAPGTAQCESVLTFVMWYIIKSSLHCVWHIPNWMTNMRNNNLNAIVPCLHITNFKPYDKNKYQQPNCNDYLLSHNQLTIWIASFEYD